MRLLVLIALMMSISVHIGFTMPAKHSVAETIGSWRGDLDGDKATEIVEITCRYREGCHPMGGAVLVSRLAQGKRHLLWQMERLNPWKLQVSDVDGDGRKDIIVGVWKKSPKDPVMAKRSFVYSWNGSRTLPMWLSSRLSRRFDDFALADVDRDGLAELFSLEIMPGGKHRIAEYRWRSFGMEWLGCTKIFNNVIGLCTSKTGIDMIMASGKHAELNCASIK